jgi:RNA polymerase sigma factor for flagellar operon FliA
MANSTTSTTQKSVKTKTKTKEKTTASGQKSTKKTVEIVELTEVADTAQEVQVEAVKTEEPAAEQKPKRRSRRACRREVTSDYTEDQLREIEAEQGMENLWHLYREYGCETMRNFLVKKYHDIVKYTAERMHMRLPNEVEVEDLMSAGLFGLMDAIEAFDTERGVKFETYCGTRIKGAIFDELRHMDWVPRLVRARSSKVDQARRTIEMQTGSKASDEQISTHMQLDSSEYKKVIRDSQPVGVVSLTRKWFETDSSKDVREIDVIKDHRQENPLNTVQRQDLQNLITKGLTRAERLIVILYYYEEMTMKEIGLTLDLSESRVSQMHSSILARLKAQMQHREKEF